MLVAEELRRRRQGRGGPEAEKRPERASRKRRLSGGEEWGLPASSLSDAPYFTTQVHISCFFLFFGFPPFSSPPSSSSSSSFSSLLFSSCVLTGGRR